MTHDAPDRIDAAEWAAQEAALAAERAGAAPATDPDVAARRRVARALRSELPPIPADFAATVARAAARQRVPWRATDRLERMLYVGIAALFAAVALLAGVDWLAAAGALLGNRWLLALAACGTVTVLLRRTLHGPRL